MAALAGCALLHVGLSLALSTAAWTTPMGVGAFCLLAMAVSLNEARRDGHDARWGWLAFAAAFLLWAASWGLLAYLDAVAKADFGVAQPTAIASSAKYIPLLLIMTPIKGVGGDRLFRAIDAIQGLVSVALITLLFFPVWFYEAGAPVSDPTGMVYRHTLTYGVTVLALLSLVYRAPSPERGKQVVLLATLLASYAVIAAVADMVIIPRLAAGKGSLLLMVADVPFALFVALVIHFRDRPVPAFLQRRPFDNEGLLLAPAGLTIFLLILSFLIGARDPTLGLWAGLATFAVFAARVGIVQTLYVRAQGEVARGERGRADFLAAITHDIRSPLTSIALSAAALSRQASDGPERAVLERRVKAGCEHVIALLDDMLTLSRLDAGIIGTARAPFDAGTVVDEVVELLVPQAAAVAVTLRRGGARHRPPMPLTGDAAQLRRALLNLVTNGIRFTPGGGQVMVTPALFGKGAGGKVRITVTDTGIGIARDRQDALLEERRAPGAPVHGAEGAGLGLAIARAAIERMGGVLYYESEPGRGSRFWLDLPLEPIQAALSEQ